MRVPRMAIIQISFHVCAAWSQSATNFAERLFEAFSLPYMALLGSFHYYYYYYFN